MEVTVKGRKYKVIETPFGVVYQSEEGEFVLPEQLEEEAREEAGAEVEGVLEIGGAEAQPEAAGEVREEAEVSERVEVPVEVPAKPEAKPAEAQPVAVEAAEAGARRAEKRRRRRRAALLGELWQAFSGAPVRLTISLRHLAVMLVYVAGTVALGVLDKYVHGALGGYGTVADAGSLLYVPVHLVALMSLTLTLATPLLLVSRVWLSVAARRPSVVDAVSYTVMAVVAASLVRKVWVVLLVAEVSGVAAGVLVALLSGLLPGVAVLLPALGLVGAVLLLLVLVALLPVVVYLALLVPCLLVSMLLLSRAARASLRTIDVALPVLVGLFMLVNRLSPELGGAVAAAASVVAAIIAASTGDLRWLRVVVAAVAVHAVPAEWSLESVFASAFQAYADIVGTPGARAAVELYLLLLGSIK